MLKLSEDEARGFDAICKGVGLIALLLGGAWTLTQYFLHKAEERETRAIESRKPFLEKRLEIYSDLAVVTATIATSKNSKETDSAKQRFWILYWGPLTLVEESEVKKMTQEFGNCIRDSACAESVLKARAEDVAASCRKSIGEGWGIRFPHPVTDLKGSAQ
jgi:hypothetical protein